MDLNIVWFILVGVLLTGYAVLDGFDLGVGMLHFFAKDDHQRRIMINSIGPVWDGNEVWLLTGGGALFAAFPHVYATVFSGFYTALMLLLFMIIFRAISIEFRSKLEMPSWRKTWDFLFSISSGLITLLFAVAIGNLINGVPLTPDKEAHIGFFELLHPYSVTIGLFGISVFLLHGLLYSMMKTDGELKETLKSHAVKIFGFFGVMYLAATAYTLSTQSHMLTNFQDTPVLLIVPIINLVAIVMAFMSFKSEKYFKAFMFSGLNVMMLFSVFAIGMFPNFVLSMPNPELSLNLYNAASSQKTLGVMFNIALIGMPLVIGYTIFIYRVFRGKVTLTDHSY